MGRTSRGDNKSKQKRQQAILRLIQENPISHIASLYNCEIEIIDNTEKSEQQELVEDLVQIITVFSCKLQGKRANKAKKLIRELMQQEETDGKSHKSNVDTKQRTEN